MNILSVARIGGTKSTMASRTILLDYDSWHLAGAS